MDLVMDLDLVMGGPGVGLGQVLGFKGSVGVGDGTGALTGVEVGVGVGVGVVDVDVDVDAGVDVVDELLTSTSGRGVGRWGHHQ